MNTNQPISTISYNSDEFLIDYLNELLIAHKIVFWCFVNHIPEELDDHTMEKAHKHVFIEPNCKLDTIVLSKDSEEHDPDHPDHPFKCINWRKSNWSDWLLYALHDPYYLRLKLQKRDFSYCKDDFFYSDEDEFFERYNQALHDSKISEMLALPKLLEQFSVEEMCALGYVRPDQAYNYSCYSRLLRLGREELQHNSKHI